jgi:homoserine dehydrogenase
METFVTRVALLGFGTVGSALAGRLADPHSRPSGLRLTHICDRRAEAKRDSSPPLAAAIAWTSRIDDLIHGDADVVVEALTGVEPAAEWLRQALLAGKSVVTANKQVVARHGPELWALAERQGRQFRFEAAIGGAMPIVRALADGLAGDRVRRITAILNGTSNAVLSRVDQTGCSLSEAVDHARRCGYAEADPGADLRGDDASAKLSILCALAFGLRVRPDDIPARSIEGIGTADFEAARRQGATIRQIARAGFDHERRLLEVGVGPELVDRHSTFGRASGPQNAALIAAEHSGEIGICGAGAGGAATAVALLSDLAAIARDRAAVVPAPRLSSDYCVRPVASPALALTEVL